MPTLPKNPVTVIGLLENFFGEHLSDKSKTKFKNISRDTADDLFHFYRNYIERHGDFLISKPESSSQLMPFLWGAVGNGGAFTGGANTDIIATNLLLNEKILITDPIDYRATLLSESLPHGSGFQSANLDEYNKYIDSLALLRPLIDSGIVNICSDRRVYRISRGETENSKNWYDDFEDSDIENFMRQKHLGSSRTIPEYKKVLGYLYLVDKYGADICTGNKRNEECLNDFFEFWQINRESQLDIANTPEYFLEINLCEAAIQDLVSIRLNEEVFYDFRKRLAEAQNAKDKSEFNSRIEQLVKNTNSRKQPFWAGGTKIFGITSVGVLIDAQATASGLPPVGTATSFGLSVIDHVIRQKYEVRLIQSENARANLNVRIAASNEYRIHHKAYSS